MKASVLLIAIHQSDGDVRPGSPLGAFRKESTGNIFTGSSCWIMKVNFCKKIMENGEDKMAREVIKKDVFEYMTEKVASKQYPA